MSLALDISRLGREVQVPFEQVARQFPLGPQHVRQLPQARIYQAAAANQTATGAFQKVPMDTTDYDLGAPSTQVDLVNDLLTCRVPGLYLVETVMFYGVAGAGAVRATRVFKNNATSVKQSNSSAAIGAVTNDALVRLVVGDTIQLDAFQDSGGNLAYQPGVALMHLAWAWISP